MALAVLAAAAVGAPAAGDANADNEPTGADELFQAGRDALLTAQYAKAVKLLDQAVAADPNKTSYRLHLARAYRYAGEDAPAKKQLEAILKVSTDHVEAGQLLAEIHADAKAWKEVLSVLEPLLKYRHDYTTYHLLARAAHSLGQADKARKYFEKAVELNPHSALDFYDLGNIYLAGHSYALAAEAYQKALALGVDSPILRYKLGSAYFNLRNYFGRVSVVTVASGKPGTLSGNWYLIEPVPGKEDTFHAAGSRSAIYQVARAVADGIKDQPDIHFLKANIYLNARRYRHAYEMFGRIEKTIPKADRPLFYYYYAQAAFGVDKLDEYLRLLHKAIELDRAAYASTLTEAYLKVAEQHNQAGDLKQYIHYLGEAVRTSPQTASLHLKLGNAYEEARRYDQAVVQWRMVLDLEPEHPERMRLLNLISKHEKKPGA
jgi:tetratricopeptide (TPR) repeat protein